jgi:superfamily I DNA/RNA helicase
MIELDDPRLGGSSRRNRCRHLAPIAKLRSKKNNLFKELKVGNLHLPRPLCNIDITVCNILNSKGLGADVVFLTGFDQGKFPAKKEASDSEVYQMLVALT